MIRRGSPAQVRDERVERVPQHDEVVRYRLIGVGVDGPVFERQVESNRLTPAQQDDPFRFSIEELHEVVAQAERLSDEVEPPLKRSQVVPENDDAEVAPEDDGAAAA